MLHQAPVQILTIYISAHTYEYRRKSAAVWKPAYLFTTPIRVIVLYWQILTTTEPSLAELPNVSLRLYQKEYYL